MQGMRETKETVGQEASPGLRFKEKLSCHSKEEEEILFTKHSWSQPFPRVKWWYRGASSSWCFGNKGKFRRSCNKSEYIASSTDDRLAFEQMMWCVGASILVNSRPYIYLFWAQNSLPSWTGCEQELWTGLRYLNVFLSQTEVSLFYKQPILHQSEHEEVPWQTPQQRWMEDFIFHLSLSDFSQLHNYLSEFHTVYRTIAELQIFHLSLLSSSRLAGFLCFIKFLLSASWLMPACMKEPVPSPTALS